jgi:restriction endonuclease Mrr
MDTRVASATDLPDNLFPPTPNHLQRLGIQMANSMLMSSEKRIRRAQYGPLHPGLNSRGVEPSFRDLQKALAGELHAAVKKASPEFFEFLVAKLFVAMGYG